MASELRFQRVTIRHFRNLAHVELEPSPALNVISGDNGHGKTSLLEALYVVATSKSFRAEKTSELIQHGAELAAVTAKIVEADLAREQRAVLGQKSRTFSSDGKRAPSLAAHARRTPVVVFHPGDLALVSGSATLRRTLLDRVALFLDPQSADHRARYLRALKERQRALEERGVSASDLDAFEELVAYHGAAVTRARRHATERLTAALGPAFARMAAPGLALRASLSAGGSDDEAEARRALAADRPKDLRRGSASFGPHRDDLELELDQKSARRHASQGQQRLLALALKLAELDTIREARGVEPVLLLDDVSSELDKERFSSVLGMLAEAPSQAFVTTPRPELFRPLAVEDRAEWRMVDGALFGC